MLLHHLLVKLILTRKPRQMCWELELLPSAVMSCLYHEMCSGSEEGSCLRLIDFCISPL